jgi:hypothetical protein
MNTPPTIIQLPSGTRITIEENKTDKTAPLTQRAAKAMAALEKLTDAELRKAYRTAVEMGLNPIRHSKMLHGLLYDEYHRKQPHPPKPDATIPDTPDANQNGTDIPSKNTKNPQAKTESNVQTLRLFLDKQTDGSPAPKPVWDAFTALCATNERHDPATLSLIEEAVSKINFQPHQRTNRTESKKPTGNDRRTATK